METNVHFPTDINLLYDAMRKVITLLAGLCTLCGFTDWRQWRYNMRQFKNLYRKTQKLKHSTSTDEQKKEAREQAIIEVHQEYIDTANELLAKARFTLEKIEGDELKIRTKIALVESFMKHAERQIDQTSRRVIKGEKIPHKEKVFSIFEEHTEWISKGKAGVPVELGMRVCILEDQHGFILNHMVMEQQTDEQVAVSMVARAKEKFPNLRTCSFDKGFYRPENREKLCEHLDLVVLPKKGKLSQKDKEREYSEEFVAQKRQHSAVESGINALEVHGLDVCPDHGLDGFKRYVALAVLARNIQQVGVEIKKQRLKSEERKDPLRKAA